MSTSRRRVYERLSALASCAATNMMRPCRQALHRRGLDGSLCCGQRDVSLLQRSLEFLSIRYDDWPFAWLVEILRNVEPEPLIEVVQERKAHRNRDLASAHVVVERNRATLTVRQIGIWLQDHLEKRLPLPIAFRG